ncbi:hypothetical protein KBA63_01925 [Candidatus Woesebacteria bacterium]|jgi:hypothetical protein|nr:hypothetical protein [Candidatus Woesebacteria bacterium]MBP9687503.1 hypothetical protein [Candidatus Woesebacteria bacterium]
MEKVVHVPAAKEHIVLEKNAKLQVTPEVILPINQEMPKEKKSSSLNIIIFVLVVLIAGVGTGFGASKLSAKGGSSTTATSQGKTMVAETQDEAGTSDVSAFPDSAEGELKEAPPEADGSHYLDRGTGKTQYVYLTSTVINLQNFVGKKVQVNGQTLASGKKAGWLMDVGRIKVIK